MTEVRTFWPSREQWVRLAKFQILGQVAMLVTALEQPAFGSWMHHPSERFVAAAVFVTGLVILVRAAKVLVAGGCSIRLAYGLALLAVPVVGFGCEVLVQTTYLTLMPLPRGRVSHVLQSSFLDGGLDMGLLGILALIIQANQMAADRMMTAVRRAESSRLQRERELLQSRSAIVQARIDPQLLIEALRQVRSDLMTSTAIAEQRLTDLIMLLRQRVRTDGSDDAQGQGYTP